MLPLLGAAYAAPKANSTEIIDTSTAAASPTARDSEGAMRVLEGWHAPSASTLHGLADEPVGATPPFAIAPSASVLTVDASSLTRADFVRRFESIAQPVLLRGAIEAWPAMRRWSREYMLKAAGRVPVSPSATPYVHGAPGGTLKDFLDEMGANATASSTAATATSAATATTAAATSAATSVAINEPPAFVFDSGRLLGQTPLGRDLGDAPPFLNVSSGDAVLRQLSISPALAGAHPHFHGAAYNALIVGRRRWALFPPHAAQFALMPALHVFQQLRYGAGSSSSSSTSSVEATLAEGDDGIAVDVEWLDAVQSAGDLLYVPLQWGHATLSLADSVAVAVEFV